MHNARLFLQSCTFSPQIANTLNYLKGQFTIIVLFKTIIYAMAAPKKIVVIGGGLAGLSYVHYLRNFCAALNKSSAIGKVTILEADKNVGGSLKSIKYDDGIVHELGPRLIKMVGVKSKNTLSLIEHLRLKEQTLTDNSFMKNGHKYIYNHGTLAKFSLSLRTLFKKLPHSNDRLISAVLHDLRTPKINLEKFENLDPSVYDFIEHRFGKDAAENCSDPLMRGISAGDARNTSVRATFQDIIDREQKYGNFFSGMKGPPVTKIEHDEIFPNDVLSSKLVEELDQKRITAITLKNGLQALPERICNSLLNTNQDDLIDIYTETKARLINLRKQETEDPSSSPVNSVEVKTIDGDTISLEADQIVASIPSENLLELLPDSLPVYHREIFSNLALIHHPPVANVCLEFRDILKKLSSVANSYGIITHSKSDSKLISIHNDSTIYPQADQGMDLFKMTCTIGGVWFEQTFGTSDPLKVSRAQIEQIALEEVRKIIGIGQDPYRVTVKLWNTGIAQYVPGHIDRLESVREKLKAYRLPITLLGQSYDGISVNEVIYASRLAAWNLVKSL